LVRSTERVCGSSTGELAALRSSDGQPWLSKRDILAGSKWNAELNKNLDEIRFGICCLTPENRDEPWVLFEAGALAKTVDDKAFVCPYLYDVEVADLPPALQQFQAKKADSQGTYDLVKSLNAALTSGALAEPQLRKAYEKWWADLEADLSRAPKPAKNRKAKEAGRNSSRHRRTTRYVEPGSLRYSRCDESNAHGNEAARFGLEESVPKYRIGTRMAH